MTDSASPVNSQWAAIIADAAQSPNKDILIETTDPLFDGQVCKATFAAPDPSDIRDGRGLQVRLSATISETITSVDGVQKTAGWVWRGRPTHVEAASNEEKAIQRAQIGCRELASALVAAKLLRRGEQPTLSSSSRCCRSSRAKRWSSASSSSRVASRTMTAPSSSSRTCASHPPEPPTPPTHPQPATTRLKEPR
jgi:hypothetical protein